MNSKGGNAGAINEIAGFATLAICIMTAISFSISIGAFEAPFWISNLDGASVIGYDGVWGEDFIVTYTDGTTESVKQISNNYWSTMAIRDDNSKPISAVQYCINAKIPSSDTFDTLGYECTISIIQDGIDLYQTSFTIMSSVYVEANSWTQIITVPLEIQSISSDLDNGIYTVSFENTGDIVGVIIPSGRSIDIVVDNNIVTFMI